MLDTALEAKVFANKDESKCFKPLIAVVRPVRDRYNNSKSYFLNGDLIQYLWSSLNNLQFLTIVPYSAYFGKFGQLHGLYHSRVFNIEG